MERLLFVVALCALSFAYGAATLQLEIFPYGLLKEAKLGWEAWATVGAGRLPKAFEKFEPGAAPRPQAKRLARGAGDEYVLVSGGPYQLMERCPTFGCVAWLTDRAGRVVHAWELDFDAARAGLAGVSGELSRLSLYPVGMALGADGSLAVTFQGRDTYPIYIGLVKIDRRGAILWKRFDHSHHWPAMDAEGRIYTPYARAARDLKHAGASAVALACRSGEASVDAIRVLGADGEPLREIPLLDALLRGGYGGLFYGLRDGCDPTHLNSVALLPEAPARAIPGAAPGDLLVSLRETSAIALLDATDGAVKYLVAGRTAAQHSPQFLPDGTVLAFDNLGGERSRGGSRIVRLDLVKGTARTVFPRAKEAELLPVRSETAGHISVSPDGERALVSLTHQGRIVEIDVASGEPLWLYDNTHDIGGFLKASGLDAPTSRARFATYGAYYVSNPTFLEEGQ
jgi:hypothetical protein